MSIAVMTEVWANAPVSGGPLLVLLALADFANEDGTCWPSIDTLAHKARLSRRQTQLVLGLLRDADLIAVERNAGPRGVNLYRVRGCENNTGAKITRVLSASVEGVLPVTPKPSLTVKDNKYYSGGNNSSRNGSRRNALAALNELRAYQAEYIAERNAG